MGVKISNLPAIVTPALTDVFPVVQSGVTYKETFTQLTSLFATAGANTNITSLGGLTTPLSVAQGGTGVATNTAYAVLVGGTTSTNPIQSVASVGTAGQVLTSNGAGAKPSFQTGVATFTSWVAYTPTFTGFGTVSNVQIWSRRTGDSLQIRGRFQSGVPTAVEARITLGYNGTNANVTSSNTTITSIQMCGNECVNFSQTANVVTLIEANTGYITFGLQSGVTAGLTKILGTDLSVDATSVLSFIANVPVDTFP
jgi:hypothetical protein